MDQYKRPIWQIIAAYLVVAVVLYGGYYYFFVSKKTSYSAPAQQKFTDSPLYKSAYQIFPGTMSDATKQAMAGFKTDIKTQADGSAIVSLTSTNTEYHNQSATVKPGETLYFIEKFGGDDSKENDTDRNLGDDTIVLVDSQGNISN